MVSEANRGHILNSVIFYKGELRLKREEPIAYSLPPIPKPDPAATYKIITEKKKWRPCLGGCGKSYMTTKWNRVCPGCTQRQEQEPEGYRMHGKDFEE